MIKIKGNISKSAGLSILSLHKNLYGNLNALED